MICYIASYVIFRFESFMHKKDIINVKGYYERVI